jgi:outer membrane protein assembly factor BamB
MRSIWTCCLFLLSLSFVGSVAGNDWPRFRGPDGAAVSDDAKVPTEWGEKKNVKWKLSMPGGGMSSPIVVGNRVFVTCWSDSGGMKRHLVCADREKGTLLWSKSVAATGSIGRGRGGMGFHGYASQTPISDGERVYVYFASSGVIAYDMEGKEVWKASVGTGNSATFGSASSPILWKDFIIVTAANESTSIFAFDRKTGKEIWKEKAGALSGCYTTPSIIKNKDGEDELIVSTTYEVWGMNPLKGKLKWYAETKVDTAACTSVVSEDSIAYVVGGRSGGRTAVKVGGKGDAKSNILWSKSGGDYVCSPVLYKGHLYWVSQRGIAFCVDAKTGNEVGRTRLRGNFYASMIAVNDKLYAQSRDSGTYVLEANPKMKELAHNSLGDSSDCSGSPAVSDGKLFLRSDKYLYCIAAE